ncbi:MAG: undecaprenyl-phosphate glucose phosphotransferase [Lachnospiraceae bacterium]|nr:undecaprenyl-phosphate glucose phosphotransferase [Lachnospiraceae bacterium]
MIKDNQRFLSRFQILLDAVVITISYFLSYYVKIVLMENRTGVLPTRYYFTAYGIIGPFFLLIFIMSRLYDDKGYDSLWRQFFGSIRSNAFAVALVLGGLYIINQPDFSRSMLIFFVSFNVLFMMIHRVVVRCIVVSLGKRGINQKAVLLVGYSRATEQYIDRLIANPEWGYVVRGILDDRIPAGVEYKGVKVLGNLANLEFILPENKLDEIGITLALEDYNKLESIVSMCEKSGVHTKFIPDYNSIIPSSPYTEDLMGLPVINIRHVPLTNIVNRVVKRTIDIIGSLVAIIIFSPVMLIAAIGISASKGGSVIFKQERVGLHNKPFIMYKFRTMIEQSPEDEESKWTKKNDERVTPFGKWLRKTSLDEIPQFFNILKGDMSLIGPRPERPYFVEQYKEKIPRYMVKHQVRPGLTGWAQVNGLRGDSSIRKRIEYDIYYIENWTLLFDIKILLMTFITGFINKNAY